MKQYAEITKTVTIIIAKSGKEKTFREGDILTLSELKKAVKVYGLSADHYKIIK